MSMPDSFFELLAAHARLSFAALLTAGAIAIPLGVLVARKPTPRAFVLGVASTIQTIPGLALLAAMVPLLAWMQLPSIGVVPAFIGLTLYGLLPMARGTVTGLDGVDVHVLRAADGVGMTPRQRLRRVELPLAFAVIMSGVRTATVWTVGMATLSTPVGAPSLGNLIFAGLQTRNDAYVLAGCLASAALALTLDTCMRGIEKGGRSRVLGLLSVVVIGVFACAPVFTSGPQASVRVGAKTFTEQYILAEALAQAIAPNEDTEVVASLGSSVAFDALVRGEIDVYVEYTGTVLAGSMSDEDVPRDQVLDRVREWLLETHQVEIACSLGFENTYALVVGEGTEATRIEDLGRAQGLSFGADYEFFERDEWRSLREAYGLEFQERRSMDPALLYDAVARGNVDVITGYSTDGRIDALNLVVLEDSRAALPPYDAIVLVRPGFRSDYPGAFEALSQLEGTIDARQMRRANRAVDRDGQSPADAAASLLGALDHHF